MTDHKHYEKIVCPECARVFKAKVEHSIPWWTYYAECPSCKYPIMESEWELAAQAGEGE